MPEIFSGANDGKLLYYFAASWATARSSTGTSVSGPGAASYDQAAVSVQYISGRGGTVAQISRAFFEFDTSGISSAPSAATLKIYGWSQTSADVIAVRGDQSGTLGNTDFDEIYGCASQLAASDGAGTGTLASCATNYSNEITSWTSLAYNDITLNSTALSEMASLDTFKVVLVEYDADYLDVASVGSTPLVRTGMFWENYTGTSRDPKIDYTAATGYGHAVMGVASANIGEVNGVATANLGKVIGVD
jgi:hypothetical protein